MDAHLAAAGSLPSDTPTLHPVDRWVQTRRGGREEEAAVCLSLTSSGPRLAEYYMSPFLPLYS